MDKLSLILIIVGVISATFSALSYLLIRRHTKNQYNVSFNDMKFFDLKSRIDYVISGSVILLGVFGILGYSSIESIKSEVEKDFKNERDTIIRLRQDIQKTLDAARLGNQLVSSNVAEAENLKKTVKEISQKAVIRSNILLVYNVRFGDYPKTSPDGDIARIDFNKLKTIDGQRLKAFKKPPLMFVQTSNAATAMLKTLTKDYFEMAIGQYMAVENDKSGSTSMDNITFSLWITEMP